MPSVLESKKLGGKQIEPMPRYEIPWDESLRRLIHYEADVGETFTIEDMYAHEASLARRYKANRNIAASIRDKLQELRDVGEIRFEGSSETSKAVYSAD